jgi:predicted dehydrogenase
MRVLIAGLGGIGQRHARNLRAMLGDRVELLAYRVRGLTHAIGPTLQADASANVERDLGIEVFHDLGAALAMRPDVALICNPNSLHVETARACVDAGCDLFIEKPLSDRIDDVEALVDAAERVRRIGMVGYQMRFHPCLQALASAIASGSLGTILAVRATIGEYLPGFHPYEDYRESYAAQAVLGGGVVLTQIHEFDYLYSLFGPIRSVYAIGGHWSHLDIDVEDVASVLMEATIDGRPLPIHVQQDYLQRPAVRQCEVAGDRGKALLDFRALSVTVFGRDGAPVVHAFADFDRNQMFIDELQHFLHCVGTRTRPLVNLRDGVESLRIALAAKESIASGAVVHLDQRQSAQARTP